MKNKQHGKISTSALTILLLTGTLSGYFLYWQKNQTLNQSNDQLLELSQQNSALSESISSAINEKNQIEASFNVFKELTERSQAENQQTITELRDRLVKSQADEQSLQQRYQRTQAELNDNQAQLAELYSQLSALRDENQSLLNTQETHNQQYSATKQKLDEQFRTSSKRIFLLEEQLAKAQQQIKQSSDLSSVANTSPASPKDQYTSQPTAKTDVKDELVKTDSTIDAIKQQLSSSKAKTEDTSLRLDTKKELITEMSSALADLTTTESRLQAESEQHKTMLAELEAQRNSLQAETNKLRKQIEALKLQLASQSKQFSQESEQLQIALEEKDQRLKDYEQQLKQREQLRNKTSESLALLNEQLQNLRQDRHSLEQSIQEKINLQVNLENQLEQAKAEQNHLQSSLKSVLEDKLRLVKLNHELELKNQKQLEAQKILEQSLAQLTSQNQVLLTQQEDGSTVIRIQSKILFRSGSTYISRQGRKALSAVAELLKTYPDHNIRVEGHTDSVAIGSALAQTYKTNWELSAARSATAVRLLTNYGVNPTRIEAVGKAHYSPINTEDSLEGMRANRRIDIHLYPEIEYKTKDL